MRLIHFAHRKEAQALLKKKLFKSCNLENIDLYESNDELLLISGEGILETLRKVSFISSRYKLSEVINLGVAGSLKDSLNINDIYQVRTVYAYTEKPEFQSFEIASQGLDLITSSERVLTSEYATKLSHFADLCDRELWGLCYALKGQKIKISSYKLVSDFAGEETNCFDIKEKSEEFSESLCKFYSNINFSKKETQIQDESLGEFEKFYLTHQHRIKLESFLNKLQRKLNSNHSEIYKLSNASIILAETSKPKEATSKLLHVLSELLDPFKKITLDKLENETKDFKAIGAKINFDPNLERKTFSLTMEINSQTNIENLKEALENLNFQKIDRILMGDIDV